MEQAVRDGIIQHNPAQVTGWQRDYQQAADELDDPRSLALPDRESLTALSDALVERSATGFTGWADVVIFAACTAARIGEVSGVRAEDIDRESWMWTVRRQTTPGPGGLIDKCATGDRRARITDHHPAVPTPGPTVDHGGGNGDERRQRLNGLINGYHRAV
nr:hypothetical protein [Salinispora mooreana]